MSTLPYHTQGSPEQMTGRQATVQLAVAGPAGQQRVTVLFRALMTVPHWFVLYFLGLVAGVIAFIGWWATLFTGRLPEFAQTYLSGYIQWSTRVQGYLMLLTDVYPPFSLEDDPGYPVRIAVPAGERLNRAAVFFRIFAVFPASVLGGFAAMGGAVVGVIAWLITLIAGKLPGSLHLAYTAILRYVTRTNCYFYMLTPAYPGGLFGDGPAAASGWAAPAYGVPGYDVPGYDVPGGYGAPRTTWQPAGWRLLLTAGARRLVGWFIGIGVAFWVIWLTVIVLIAVSAGNVLVSQHAINTMNAANDTLSAHTRTWNSQAHACRTVACAARSDATAATAFADFATTVRDTAMPPDAVSAANRLYSDATAVARVLTRLSKATSVSRYNSELANSGLRQTLRQMSRDNDTLGAVLNTSH